MNASATTEARPAYLRLYDQIEAALAAPSVRVAVLGVVLLVTFLAYSQTLLFKFVYDDSGQIVQNNLVHSWAHAKDLFRMHVWAQQFNAGNYYRPLFVFLLLTEYSLFHLHPLGWHFVSVLFHLGATLSVYWLATKFTTTRSGAIVAALLFGIEPIHVESVAWVSGVTDPLLAVFAVSSVVCYINFRTRNRHKSRWLAASVALFACALLSKETAVIVPAIVVIYEWLFGPADRRQDPSLADFSMWFAPIALFGLAGAAYVWVRFKVLHSFSRDITPLAPYTALYTGPRALWFYAGHLLWPFNLSLFYEVPYSYRPDFRMFVLPAVALGALIVSIAVMAWTRGSRPVRFFLWWLILPLLPVLNFGLFPFGEVVHDRYLYLSSIGFVLLLALAWEALLPRMEAQYAICLVCLLAVVLSVATIYESLPWADNLVLFNHAVQKSPRLNVARNWLANELYERGMYAEAVAEYRADLENNPSYFFSDYNLAFAYLKLGKFAEAEEFFRRATDVNPDKPDAWVNLGLSRLYQHKLDLAESAILTGLQMNPTGTGYHSALGDLRYEEGNYDAALDAYRTELWLHPEQGYARERIKALSGLHSGS